MGRIRTFKLSLAALTVAGLAILTSNCGNGTGTKLPPVFQQPTGTVSFLASDAPLCDVAGFKVTITSATLTPASGGSPVTLLASTNPVTVDFASLMDFSTFLSQTRIPQGTYSTLNLTLSDPQITVLDTTVSPPTSSPLATTFSSLSVSITLSPELTVSSGGASSVQLDFDLRNSILTKNGQVTGQVTPVATAGAVTASSSGFGELQKLAGIVQSVSSTGTNSAFSGSFTLQLPSGATPTVNISSNSVFDGVSGLSGLNAGKSFVEVDASVDSSNNVVANYVKAEADENAAQNLAAFIGVVTSVTRSSGSATQFTLFVRNEAPSLSSVIPLGSSVAVNITPATTFGISAPALNKGNLPFDATALGVGQAVVVHGVGKTGTSNSVTANEVFLSVQSVVGNFTSPPQPAIGSDGVTGGFTFVPCSTLFAGQNITVFTFNSTAFPGVTNSGLAGLTPTPTLVTKGLVFFSPITVTLNGEGATPPATVEEADQVHQLP